MRAESLSVKEPSSRIFLGFAVLALSAAMLFGGGTRQGLIGDLVAQLAALPLLVMSVWRFKWSALGAAEKFAVVLVVAIMLLMLAQLLPLPFDLWRQLPGRAGLVVDFDLAGVAAPSWLPISLDPEATESMLWGLIPAVALFLACLSLPWPDRRRLVAVLLVLAALNVVLGLAQVAGGPQSPLRFYSQTNIDATVGFFANSSHYAALLYLALPLSAAWVVTTREERALGSASMLKLATGLLVLALLILGLILARSRAGLALGMLALLSSFALIWRGTERGAGAMRGFMFIAVLGVLLGVQYGLYGVLRSVDRDMAEDSRWDFFQTTREAARHFGPIGSGFGTFEKAYQHFEPVANTMNVIINHAHNDWLELWLEGGWPAMILAAAFVAWLIWVSLRAWRKRSGSASNVFARAASLAVVLVLLHEFVDYSLRTTVIMAVFGLLCGLMSRSKTRSRGEFAVNSGRRGSAAFPVANFGRG